LDEFHSKELLAMNYQRRPNRAVIHVIDVENN